MDKIKKYWFPGLSFLLSLVTALFWVALRINHSGISKFLGADTNQSFLIMNLPVMVTVLAWVGVAFALLGIALWGKRKWPAVTGFVIGLVMLIAALAVIHFGAKDYLRFILVHFWNTLAVSGCIIGFALILFFPPRWRKGVKIALLAVVILTAVVIGYRLRPCEISCGAAVYAVEDDYQIIFATSDSAIAWVEIGEERYYDLYAGSMKSADNVHKIEVPQTVLDAAGGYRICARQMIYRGPFGGYTGKTISQDYSFRPVDASDGLHYFSLSDVHEAVDAAIESTQSPNIGPWDFIVLLGDLVSMVETEEDALLANNLAHGITGGEIPVLYARGNHEIKGEYGEDLYKYVGAKGTDYYYTATLGEDVFIIVLDMGEDHEDDWWEYYGTAQFDLYRQAQTEMLEDILADGDYQNYRYRLALCHIPVTYVDKNGYFEAFRNAWTALLNEIDVDMCLSGHKHVLWPFIPGQVEPYETLVYSKAYAGQEGKTEGGYLTDFNFPGFLVGRRSLGQEGGTQSDGYDEYLGLATSVSFEDGIQTSCYVNSCHEIPNCAYPFAEDTFASIVTQLKRPEK